jgi:hypothetical protein
MYRNEEMFPNEETVSHDFTVDDASSTLRVTADLSFREKRSNND